MMKEVPLPWISTDRPVLLAGINITSERESLVGFTYHYFESLLKKPRGEAAVI